MYWLLIRRQLKQLLPLSLTYYYCLFYIFIEINFIAFFLRISDIHLYFDFVHFASWFCLHTQHINPSCELRTVVIIVCHQVYLDSPVTCVCSSCLGAYLWKLQNMLFHRSNDRPRVYGWITDYRLGILWHRLRYAIFWLMIDLVKWLTEVIRASTDQR